MSWQLFREAFFTQIRHPTTIAAFASVSLHAVVGVALPTLPYFAPEVEVGMGEGRPQNVQVIELSQAELGRLPDLSPPPIADLPDFPTNLPDATVTIPPSSSPETTTDLPPNLPSRPDTRISRSNPNEAYPYPTVEPSPNLPPRPDRSRTVIRPSAPRRSVGQRARRLPPQTSTPSPQNRTPSIFGIDKTNRFELENPDNPADLLPRLPEDTRIGVASPTLQREREERETPDADPSPISDSDNRPLLSEEELLARRTAEEEVLPLQEDLRRRDEDTSPEEVQENERRWLANQSQAEPRSRSITGNYPEDACLRKLSGRVMYGAIAQPNGGLGNIRRLQSSGYWIFDRQARSQLQGLSFSVEQPTPYRITVNFNYNRDNCPTTLSVPNPPSPSPTPSNPQPQNQQQE
ncbi:TonB family protein, partial [Spirulina sp. CS-785/01]|uniref:TonB family protein n=1 Tax=Spirulina sp. CS-785/01 TaxID=3021716 RepID=UPI00232E2A1F